MSVSQMKKLTVVARKDAADTIVRRLMRLRAVSLSPPSEADSALVESFAPNTDVTAAAAKVARIEAVLPVLNRKSKRKKPLFGGQTQVSLEDFRDEGRYETAWKVVEEAEKILEEKQRLLGVIESACTSMRSFEPYLDLEFPLNFSGTDKAAYILGSLPAGTKIDRVEDALEGMAAEAEVMSEDSTGLYICLIAHRAEEENALRALAGLGFLRATLPLSPKTVKTLFDESRRERLQTENMLEKLETRLAVLAERLTDLEILYDIERTTLLAEENKRELHMTDQCVLLCGWCPAKAEERITELLEDHGAAYRFENPAEGEEAPILLANRGFAKNFEWVLGMYAYPKYGSFDPTFIMSIFYFLIFGLMFADAGYGLVLTLACFGIVRWCHPREGMKRFLLMFGYCGISCIIFGVLFGSYFGNFPLAFMENVLGTPVNRLPNLSLLPTEAANLAVLFDPLQNPMAFLVVSLAMGALHLLAGMAVQAFILCKKGKWLDALFDIATYWLLFAGIGVIFVHKTAGIVLTLCGVASIIATQGRHKKGIPMKIAGGFLGIYNLINYASDLLSYSRVLALGLAAGVIGQVVNILATLKGASFIGILLMIVVFCVGHLLNLVINVLGTFVHTSRLQYIEFFNKFYEEGGTPFKPMTPSDRYTEEVATKGIADDKDADEDDADEADGAENENTDDPAVE